MRPVLICLVTLCLGVSSVARADEGRQTAPNALHQQECGSCHVPFPARLLGQGAWRSLMGSLDKHFGSDASLDTATRDAIERYLVANAARSERLSPGGKPTQRITETAWYGHEHDEVGPAVWRRASIGKPSNCAACHTRAEQGSFSERQIRIPQ